MYRSTRICSNCSVTACKVPRPTSHRDIRLEILKLVHWHQDQEQRKTGSPFLPVLLDEEMVPCSHYGNTWDKFWSTVRCIPQLECIQCCILWMDESTYDKIENVARIFQRCYDHVPCLFDDVHDVICYRPWCVVQHWLCIHCIIWNFGCC